jgi:neutral ceramidase
MKFPYAWHPTLIDTQMVRLGDFVVAALPGEFTTMAGRRMREMLEGASDETVAKVTDKIIAFGHSLNQVRFKGG